MPKKIVDKSEGQKAAEANVESFRDERGPFVVAAQETRMAMVFTDTKEPGHPIIFANDAFLSLTGYAREEVLGQDFNFLMQRGADAAALAKIESEFKRHSEGGAEIQYRARMAVFSGPSSSLARFAMRTKTSFSISPPSSMSRDTRRSRPNPRCSLTS
ncbi:PAS domain-containing protein [Nitratireductor luteus]|uniref:PAS domain-containing protein n=1 Tax=Nitratireductor luteus TaxID=2976980 RepID=UPI00223FFBBA